MVGVRYIGSKARVADVILDLAGAPEDGRFIDAFCGTGSVAKAAAARGWHFAYFGHVDDAEIQTIDALLATAPAAALTPALELARHLAVFEDLFWQRMLALCAPDPTD